MIFKLYIYLHTFGMNKTRETARKSIYGSDVRIVGRRDRLLGGLLMLIISYFA